MKYYLIAGEASGDIHASRLMHELKAQDPKAEFRYYGGDAMEKEGGTLVCHYSKLAYMGFYQVVIHLQEILSGMRDCKKDIAAYKPDAVILIDYPGFNLGIAKWVKKNLKAKVFYYISPKIWAWKTYRLKDIKKYVDEMLCILPFEVDFYKKQNYEVTYVGNPTVDELAPLREEDFDREAFCEKNDINANQPIIALLAGSRKAEVAGNLPIMLEAVQTIPCHEIVIAGAPGLSPEFYEPILSHYKKVPPVHLIFGQTHDLLRAAEVAAVTSGTATLETAYLNVPQVVCYQFKGGMLVYKIMQVALHRIRYVSLVNLLLGKESVVELLGPYLTPKRLKQEIVKILDDCLDRRQMLEEYQRMRDMLGEPGAPVRAAERIINILNNN